MTIPIGLAAEVVRYGVKGGGTMLINIALMAGIVELGGIDPRFAAIASTSAVIVLGYVLMQYWVFPDSNTLDARGHAKRGLLYYALIFAGKAANYAVFLALLALGVWYPAAWVIGAVIVFAGLFSANRVLWKGDLVT